MGVDRVAHCFLTYHRALEVLFVQVFSETLYIFFTLQMYRNVECDFELSFMPYSFYYSVAVVTHLLYLTLEVISDSGEVSNMLLNLLLLWLSAVLPLQLSQLFFESETTADTI